MRDENYRANRDVEKELGGFILMAESKKEIFELQENTIEVLLPEYTDIIKSDDGIDYYSSLFILSDDYSIVVFSIKEFHEIIVGKEKRKITSVN